MWRYVVHLTGDPAGADDIVQETLLRAWRSPADPRPGAGVDPVVDVHRRAQPRDRRGCAARVAAMRSAVAELPERVQDDATDALFESLLVEEALRT